MGAATRFLESLAFFSDCSCKLGKADFASSQRIESGPTRWSGWSKVVEVTHFFGLRRSIGTSLAPSPSLFLVSSSRQTKMEATPSQLPESYEFSQSQFTQTQPQTQPETQPGQASSTLFPSNLWGILLSSSGEASTSTSLPNGVNGGGGGTTISDRPTRFELVRPSCGGKQVYEIGRHPRSDLRMNSPKVSNSHARISISDTDGLVRLEDLSTNGTHVRGIKVSTSFWQLYCSEAESRERRKLLGNRSDFACESRFRNQPSFVKAENARRTLEDNLNVERKS